jgi:predicted ester cyclase
MPAPGPGVEGLTAVIGAFTAAFPDIQITLEQVLADGDFVSTYGYYTGTQNGDFMGIPATGKTVKVYYSDLWRLENGKAVENWVVMDNLSMMQQLGVIPAPEAAATA